MPYIHLGSDVSIPASEILGVFDIEQVTEYSDTVNDYLADCQKSGRIYYVSLDLPRSFVLTQGVTYVTNVSAPTLRRRMGLLLK
ncbi:hypothetical protein FACS1894120_5780 [Clostridia bacterium]|nr:hypothetical protein FACS1894120_5780 [Clostridia bacterium]